MDPRAVLYPVGPHEPRVYWTRRAILLAAFLLVVVLLAAYGCSGGSAHPTANRPATTPTASRTPAPVTTTPAPSSVCTARQLTVAASTDAATYPAGVPPHL